MIRALILLVALAAPPRAAHWPVAGGGYVLSTGYPLGMLGFNVCTQVADDTTPDLIGAAADGCNILETSPGHSGAVAITDLDNPLVGSIVWIVGADGVGASTTIADSGNFNLETTWTGTTDNVLELYVQADNDYVEVTRHNGVRYFDGLVTLNGGAVLGADMDTNGQGLTDLTDGIVTVNVDLELAFGGTVFTPTVATDATAYELSFQAGNANHLATANPDGAPNVQCGGIAVKSMAVVQATAATSTITITTVDAAGTYTSTTLTLVAAAPGANEILCETSDAVCGAAIVTYLTSNVPGVTGELVTAQVYLIPSATMCAMGLASADGGGTKFVLTNGVDGAVSMHSALRMNGNTIELVGAGTPNIFGSGGTIWMNPTGGAAMSMSGSLVTTFSPLVIPAAASLSFSGLTRLQAGDSSDDGHLQQCNAGETQCFTWIASAANTVTLADKAGTGTGSLVVGGSITSPQHYFDIAKTTLAQASGGNLLYSGPAGFSITSTAVNASADAYRLRIQTDTSAEMTASSGTQYGTLFLEEINQSGTGAYVSDELIVTDTGSGSGQDYFKRRRWGATGPYQFKRQDDGDMILHEDPGSDTAPLDGKIVAANAYAQATGGSRNGASLEEGAGVRTLQIVCSDPTKTDTDLATFVVDGVDTVLTESTDFDCHGETAEVCCDNFGTVITTNVATIKMVPDCDTTAGTCYLTPLEDVLWVEDIYFTDGGVDDVGWTLTEGIDGDIGLYGEDILTKIWNVDYVVRAGSAGLGPTAPGWGENDSCAGLAFDADAQSTHINFEVPSCWAGRTRDDLTFKVYWCPENGQDPANGEVVKWDSSYRVLDWGTDDVDTGAAVVGTVTYTQSGAGDEGDTFIHTITIDADDSDQPIVKGETLAIRFDRDWGVGSNYPHDGIIALWEILVPQTSLKCDHHN